MTSDQSTYSIILCQLLAQEMGERGMTQQEFFKESGISQATWSRINRGLTHLNIENLRSAVGVLGLSLPDIMAKADRVAAALPEEGIEVVETVKSSKSGDEDLSGGQIAVGLITGAALIFLISRILRK